MKSWFALYPSDLIADTVEMDVREFGAYMRLLCHAYLNDGVIPSDPRRMARILGCHSNLARSLWGSIGVRWYEVDGGFRHKRVDEELEKREKKSKVGQKAARKRWDANAHANALQMDTQPQPQPQLDTELSANTTSQVNGNISDSAYRYEGKIVRLNEGDYNRWKASFKHLDLDAELTARDAWLTEQPPEIQKRWFVSTSTHLKNLNAKGGADERTGTEPFWRQLERAEREAAAAAGGHAADTDGPGDGVRESVAGKVANGAP